MKSFRLMPVRRARLATHFGQYSGNVLRCGSERRQVRHAASDEERRQVVQRMVGLVGAFLVAMASPAWAQPTAVVRFAPQGYAVGDYLLRYVAESAGTIELPVERTGDLSHQVMVRYVVTDETTQSGADYTCAAGGLVFDPGVTRRLVILNLLRDDLVEPPEYLRVTLEDPSVGAVLETPRQVRVGVLDTTGGFRVATNVMWVAENQAQVTLTVEQTDLLTVSASVDYAVVPVTATAGEDVVPATGTLSFAVDQGSTNLLIGLLNDAKPEPTESFRVVLSNPSGGARLSDRDTAEVFILDNDVGVQFAAAVVPVNEDGGSVDCTVLRGDDLGLPFTVDYATSDETAVAGVDYAATAGTVRFGAGEMNRVITIPILNDGVRESWETFQVVLSHATGGTGLGRRARLRVQVNDNDPGVRFLQNAHRLAENGGAFTVWVERGNDVPNESFTVGYATSGGTASPGLDYAATAGILTFGVGETTNAIIIPVLNDGLREPEESFELALGPVSGEVNLGEPATATLWIEDNDAGLSFAQRYLWVDEDDGAVTVTVSRGNDVEVRECAVDFATSGGTATPDADYATVLGTLVFAEGQQQRTITIPLLNDGLHEPIESFQLSLSQLMGAASWGDWTTATIYIRDNDPGVRFSEATYQVGEDCGSATVTVLRGADADLGPFSVSYATSAGTATPGFDYLEVSGTLEFATGEESRTVAIPILNDLLDESNDSFYLTLSQVVGGAGLGELRTATIRLIDSIPGHDPGVRLNAGVLEVSEAGGAVTLIVHRGDDVDTGPFTVQYATSDATAVAGVDYTATSGTLSFAAGEQSQTIAIAILNDGLREPEEAFRLILSEVTGNASLGRPTTATVWIGDNDPGSRFGQSEYSVAEDSGKVTLLVDRGSDIALEPVTVKYETSDGTARAGADYRTTSGALTFAVWEQGKSITVPILNDGLQEPEEIFTLTLSQVTGGVSLGVPTRATVRVSDNDPGVSFSSSGHSVEESNGMVTVRVNRGNDFETGPFTVNYATSDGTATAGTDYTATSGTLTFGPGEQGQTIGIRILNDGVREEWETFELSLSQVTGGARLGEPATAMISIRDNDPGVHLTQYEYWVAEDGGTATVWVDRGNDVEIGPFTVDYATSRGTAIAGLDYTEMSGTLTFGAGEQTKPINIPILNDGLREPREVFYLALSRPSGGVRLSTAGIWIADNDPGVRLTQREYRVAEEGGTATVWVDRGNDVETGPFTVDYATSRGTATAGADYTATSGTLTFGAGEQIKPVNIPILNDGLCEPSEDFDLALSQVTGAATLGEPATAVIQIGDNDPGVSFSHKEFSAAENCYRATVWVRRGNDVETGPFTVNYATSDGTAVAGLDYTPTSGVLTFAVGEQSKSIEVPILNDGLRELEESFQLTLSQVSGGVSLGEPVSATIWIADNDLGVHLTQYEYWVAEDGGTATVWVDRGNDVEIGPLTVDYTTSSGTAIVGLDYAGTSGVLTFGVGEQGKSITIPILNDGLREPEEHFQVTLSQVSGGASLGEPTTATIRIVDNDLGVCWSSSSYGIGEAAGRLLATVRRGNDGDLYPLTASYEVVGISATAGQDFVAASGTLSWGAGEGDKQLEIQILNDALRESGETLELRLTATSSPAGLGEPRTATVEIQDNDPGVGFKVGTWEVGEGAGTVAVTVMRGNDVDLGPMGVDYVLVDETARAGVDYEGWSGRLEFGVGEVEKTFTVVVLDDRAWEGDELIRVLLTNHVGSGVLNGSPEGWVRILDDDPVSWEQVSGFTEAYGFRDMAWGGGRWVIPYEGPGVLWSTNGWEWEREEMAELLERVAYGGDRFVGVSGSGAVYGSTNGITWESLGAVSAMSIYPQQLVYGGGQFVLVTGEPKVWVSTNGVGWVEAGIPGGIGWMRELSYGNGGYVGVSDTGWALVSTNGLEWEAVSVVQGALWGVAYGEGRYVAVGERPDSQGNAERVVAESVDGQAWVLQVVTNALYGAQLVYGEGRFVLVGSGIWVLERGSGGWEVRQVSWLNADRVGYGGGRFVGVSYDGIRVSEEGLVWGAPTANYRNVVFGEGEFVVMADSQYGWRSSTYAILSSADGRSWVPRASGDGWSRGLARGAGLYVAALGGDRIGKRGEAGSHFLRSTNGVDWVEVGLGDTETRHSYVNGLGYGVSRFVAVGRQYGETRGGDAGMVWTSEDGLRWEGRALVWPGSLSSVSARPEEVVVRGDDYNFGPVAYRTVDGTNWVSVPLDQTEPQIAVQSVWPLEVGVGSGTVWLRRGSAEAWVGCDLPGGVYASGVAYCPGWLLAVGDRGTVWVSSPLVGVEFLGWTPNGELRLVITGPAGSRYDVERSVNLVSWEVVGEVTATGNRQEVWVADPGGGEAWFYRAVMK